MFGAKMNFFDAGKILWHAKSIDVALEPTVLLYVDFVMYMNRRSRLV